MKDFLTDAIGITLLFIILLIIIFVGSIYYI